MTQISLWLGAAIFCCGMFGVLTRRNMILLFLSLELMLFGICLNFISFGYQHGDGGGQVFALIILTVAACEASLALAIVVSLYRRKATLDTNSWHQLGDASSSQDSEDSWPRATETTVVPPTEASYPKLARAGLDPLLYPSLEHTPTNHSA